ncbi:hypothetical protein GJ744_001282 [Endocarpon pusillum]|uniref:Uncharacterized protein n=1 Tax=Endocarpon pusillum TaxID=364733 RepID=A0A8H7E1W8_9EURO|nr:hypothetical protein GJ744_001282 [Endocarpon pusillum]
MENQDRYTRIQDARIGSAKIHIRHLRGEGIREIDGRNVKRLVEVFASHGCDRLEPAYRVPIVVSVQEITRILLRNAIEAKALHSANPPRLSLDISSSVTCLRGQHRLAAGQVFFSQEDEQWWGVDIYRAEGLSQSDCQWMSEEYENALPFNDGMIFRSIRIHQIRNNKTEAEKWLARLSGNSKRRDIAQLQKRKLFVNLSNALDQLLPLPGLWSGFQVGTFHRLLSMKFPEELAHYLNHISRVWQFIIGPCSSTLPLDSHTVRSLEGRSPFFSTADRQFIQHLFEAGELFSSMSISARKEAHSRVLQVKTIIPSLRTFLQDSIFLEPCFLVLRHLLPPKFKGTIREGLFERYSPPQQGQTLIQTTEMEFVTVGETTEDFAFTSALCQLMLFALRNYPYMTNLRPRKTKRVLRLWDERASSHCWLLLAYTASKLGFDTPDIWRKSADNPNLANCQRLLPIHRPTGNSSPDSEILAQEVRSLALSQEPKQVVDGPQMTKEVHEDWRFDYRCGRPFDRAYDDDLPYMFFHALYNFKEPVSRVNITSFMVTCDIFHAFFGSGIGHDVHSTIGEKSAEHSEMDVEYDRSEPQSDGGRQTSDKVDVDMGDEGATSRSPDVPDAPRPGAAIEPQRTRFQEQGDNEQLVDVPVQAQTDHVNCNPAAGLVILNSVNAAPAEEAVGPSSVYIQPFQVQQLLVTEQPFEVINEVNRGTVRDSDFVGHSETSIRSHRGLVLSTPKHTGFNLTDEPEESDQLLCIEGVSTAEDERDECLANQQYSLDQAQSSANSSTHELDILQSELATNEHTPLTIGLSESATRNVDLKRGSGQTIFPGERSGSFHNGKDAGSLTSPVAHDPAMSPLSDGHQGNRPHQPDFSPPMKPRLERLRGRSQSPVREKDKNRTRSPSARTRVAILPKDTPSNPTEDETILPVDNSPEAQIQKTDALLRPRTIFPGEIQDSGKVSPQSVHDSHQASPPNGLLHKGRKRRFLRYTFKKVTLEFPPHFTVTPNAVTFSGITSNVSIGQILLYLDAWMRDFLWSKVLPSFVFEKDNESYRCTLYNQKEESKTEMKHHLQAGRAAKALLATANLDLPLAQWQVINPRKYQSLLDTKQPILMTSTQGFSNGIFFGSNEESAVAFPYWDPELGWKFVEIQSSESDEPNRKKRSKIKHVSNII